MYLFLCWFQGLLVLGYNTLQSITIWVHFCPCVSGLFRLISFVDCSLDFRLTDLWGTELPPFTKVFLGGILQWVLWRMASNRPSL